MMLIIDNYDSFTYNLVQYFGELGAKLEVVRNDKTTIQKIKKMQPERIVISPGPKSPKEAGLSNEIIFEFKDKLPLLGVCLGHQCIGYVFGGNVIRADRLMHGKTSQIHHNKKDLFKGLKNPFEATRYHSLIVSRNNFPKCLKITAWTKEGEIMGIKHRDYPVFGVQFHPESILTKPGMEILKNFLEA
ncbi:MAG: aminodeoxychorismate/anthranilate synthase component II [Candidatus Firestonebacteria bacterium]